MRVIGGQIPWEGVSFPKPPEGCAAEPTAKPTATAKPTPAAKPAGATKPAPSVSTPALSTHNVAQTSVLPKGGVAAGAEIAQENSGDTTALIAGGASTLALDAAGAGFVVLRRRTAKQN
ncbi:sortase-dependent protein [Streptomyces sp. NPDC051000]|uniref:sortase-dependent protein n=1 Tax=Streptomyces sp. NPDC051000 TaxID=3155520 RepID=UPI0033C846FA